MNTNEASLNGDSFFYFNCQFVSVEKAIEARRGKLIAKYLEFKCV